MISLDINKFQHELSDFLSIGKRWLFVPGYVYTTNEAKNVFARLVMPGLEANEAIDPLMRMDKLEEVLTLKSVKIIKIAVSSGFILIDSEKLQMQKQIAREDNPEDVAKLKKYNENCRLIEIAKEDVSEFEIEGQLLTDALDQVGSPKEPILFETGNSLRITSDSGQSATLPKVKADQKATIGLSMEAQGHLRKAISDMTKIKIKESGPYCVFKSPRLTVMAGGLAKWKS